MVDSWSIFYTFAVIFAATAPHPRWWRKPCNGLFISFAIETSDLILFAETNTRRLPYTKLVHWIYSGTQTLLILNISLASQQTRRPLTFKCCLVKLSLTKNYSLQQTFARHSTCLYSFGCFWSQIILRFAFPWFLIWTLRIYKVLLALFSDIVFISHFLNQVTCLLSVL